MFLSGMWDLPRPGIEPVSPALAGRVFTTEPLGKPQKKGEYRAIRYFERERETTFI